MTTKQLLDLVYARLARSLTLSHADVERMAAVLDEIERDAQQQRENKYETQDDGHHE